MHTGTSIAKIESRLLVEGMARVGVRDVHIRKRQAVEEVSAIVSNVVNDHALALVEADSERPLLPTTPSAIEGSQHNLQTTGSLKVLTTQ